MGPLGWLLVLLLVGVVGYILRWIKKDYDRRYFDSYQTPSDLPLHGKVVSKKNLHPGHVIEKITLQGTDGSTIPAFFHYPIHATDEPVPCIVMLYGIAQTMKCSKEFAHKLVANGFALICHEQLGRGSRDDKKNTNIVQKLFYLRTRCAVTVVESRRIVDYLTTRSEVDTSKLYVLGVSLGAMLGTYSLAQEPRFSGGMLMWGGADFSRIVTESEIAQVLVRRWQRPFLKYGERWFKPIPADPMDSLPHLGDKPLLLQNPLQDEIIPRSSIDLFHNLAPEGSKTIKWYPCTHEVISMDVRRQIAEDQIAWLKEISSTQSPYGED